MPYTVWSDGHERVLPWRASIQPADSAHGSGFWVVVADTHGRVVARSALYEHADGAVLALQLALRDPLGGFPDVEAASQDYLGRTDWSTGLSLTTAPLKDKDAAARVALKLSFAEFDHDLR